MKISIGHRTDPGPREGENQDSILVATSEKQPDMHLLIVADGMGGANAGEHASRQAVAVIKEKLLDGESIKTSLIPERLEQAIKDANLAIYQKSQSEEQYEGMGCTVVLALIVDDEYWLASVGDSRAYLVREQKITQLTTDHTWVNARVREGLLTPEQAAKHSLLHVLDRALGVDEEVEVDILPDDILEEGDALVLCTDGLHGVLDDKVIAWASSNHNAAEAADILLERALQAPARDNTSVIVFRVGDPDPAEKWSLDS